jgi:aflatoxin B1 aldehyde reductase
MSGGLKIVFGAAGFNPGSAFPDSEAINAGLDLLEKNGVKTLDTAQRYGESEKLLGEANAGSRFIIDTKSQGGFVPGSALKPENLYKLTHQSVEKLKVSNVDIFYIHAPDSTIELAEWVPVIDKLYKEGLFQRFGLSNYKPEDVRAVYDYSKKNGLVLPSAYQGNYSPIARLPDTTLFPVLRELKIAFYAYSPLAGGFLTKTRAQIEEGKIGRFVPGTVLGDMYRNLYAKPTYLDALSEWESIANDEGTSRAELAYRWVNYHSPLKAEHGDAIIFGASSSEQLVQTVQGLKRGPLKESTVKRIDEVWEKIKHEAPLDNYHSHTALQK